MDSNAIGEMVRYFRKQGGLTQIQLAQLAGVGKTVIFDIEKGKATVQLDSLIKILAVLNIKMEFKTPFKQPVEDSK